MKVSHIYETAVFSCYLLSRMYNVFLGIGRMLKWVEPHFFYYDDSRVFNDGTRKR
jgi:hypothetical protein